MGRLIDVQPTSIVGVVVLQSRAHSDHRGSFTRLFCDDELREIVGQRRVVQSNLSCAHTRGAVRGMHFQRAPHAEMKIVRCLRGRIWDVALDLRANSPTLLKWHAEELTPGNARALVIPEGCAHGFQVLEPDSEVLYLHTAAYRPEAEGGVAYDDPRIGIPWPLPAQDLSARDQRHPRIPADFNGLEA
jgi:dTDP-4-dehydrorhamnose 3,5-epimerase